MQATAANAGNIEALYDDNVATGVAAILLTSHIWKLPLLTAGQLGMNVIMLALLSPAGGEIGDVDEGIMVFHISSFY